MISTVKILTLSVALFVFAGTVMCHEEDPVKGILIITLGSFFLGFIVHKLFRRWEI